MICKLKLDGYTQPIVACFILTMWYVNYCVGTAGTTPSTCFILTMWYVNFSISFNVFWDNLVLY